MPTLKQVIEDTDTWQGRTFDLVIQSLIVISLISFSLETLPDLSSKSQRVLRYIEIVSVLVFTLEYCLRLVVSDSKFRLAFSFYGLVDLAAILPFYLTAGVDLRAIRVFRLLRLFRVIKIARYTQAVQRLRAAFTAVKQELIIFFSATMLLLYFSAVGIYYFEHDIQPEAFASIFDCLWWAVATLTTVGYGDVYPVSIGGRAFTFVILMIGLGIVAVPTGLIASALSAAGTSQRRGEDP